MGEAYQQLLELERRSQGRVMSRPVSACTRMLAPLLLQDWEVRRGVPRAMKPALPSSVVEQMRAAAEPPSCARTLLPASQHAPAASRPPLQHLKSDMAPDEFLHSLKCRLARMTLAALRQLHRRGRLMEGVLWQLNSYILNCLEKAGEAAVDGLQQEELG